MSDATSDNDGGAATFAGAAKRVRELEARVAELEAQRSLDGLWLQTRTATDLLKIVDPQALYDLVGKRIAQAARDAIVTITEFEPGCRSVVVRSIQCTPDERQIIARLLGRDPVGLSLDLPDETRQRWKPGQLAPVPGRVYDLLFRRVPPDICAKLEEALRVHEVFGMACAYEEDILGSVAVVTRGRSRLGKHRVIEALVAQAALALKRLRADEERKRTEARFRLLFDTTSDGVWVHTLDGVIREVNDAYCAMSGYSRSELVGMPISRLEANESPDAIDRHIRKVIDGGGHDRFESSHRRKNGTTFDVDITALHVAGRDDGRMAIFVRDVTERRRAEEALSAANAKLQETDRRKDEFLAMLAHELRNPLAVIASASRIFGMAGLADAERERARDALARQARHMGRLIDDLLDVSRVTQGKIGLKHEPVDLSGSVRDAVEAAGESIEAKGHRLFVSLPREPLLLDADAVRLTQAVSNLLNNAAKYTPAGGEIHVSAERSNDGGAVVRVRDNGIGIEAELLPRLFDLFVQGDRSPERAQGGLGIGLTMARSLVELHGGWIEAQSEGPGRGSEFVVWLPLTATEQPEARPDAAAATPVASRRILVVDDNKDAAEMMRLMLQLEGHEVVAAGGGRQAIDLAPAFRPEVVFVDLGMPGMDGFEVARRLRQEPALAGSLLVALTGYGQEEDVQKSREAGFDHHLIKSADFGPLRELLDGLLRAET